MNFLKELIWHYLIFLFYKTGKAIRFSPLEAICKALDCQPADILEYVKE